MKNTRNNRIKQVNNSLLFLKTTRKYENMRKIYLSKSKRRRKFILYIFSEYFLVIIVIVLKIQSS